MGAYPTKLLTSRLMAPAWKVPRLYHLGWLEAVTTATRPDESEGWFNETVTIQLWGKEKPGEEFYAWFEFDLPAYTDRLVVPCDFINTYGFPDLVSIPAGCEVIAVHSPLNSGTAYTFGPPRLTVQPHGTYL